MPQFTAASGDITTGVEALSCIQNSINERESNFLFAF
jgi:hypothetical protein